MEGLPIAEQRAERERVGAALGIEIGVFTGGFGAERWAELGQHAPGQPGVEGLVALGAGAAEEGRGEIGRLPPGFGVSAGDVLVLDQRAGFGVEGGALVDDRVPVGGALHRKVLIGFARLAFAFTRAGADSRVGWQYLAALLFDRRDQLPGTPVGQARFFFREGAEGGGFTATFAESFGVFGGAVAAEHDPVAVGGVGGEADERGRDADHFLAFARHRAARGASAAPAKRSVGSLASYSVSVSYWKM